MIHKWFPTAVMFQEEILSQSENEKLYNHIKYLNNVVKKGGEDWLSDVKNTSGTYDCNKDNAFNFLHKKVSLYVNEFSQKFGCVKKMICENSWYNYYKKGDYQEFHTHPYNYFSAVYFVRCLKNSSPLCFQSPYSNNMLPLPVKKYNDLSFDIIEYEPVNNSLVIFRSNIPHMVPKNKSQERITMSFNYKLEEKE